MGQGEHGHVAEINDVGKPADPSQGLYQRKSISFLMRQRQQKECNRGQDREADACLWKVLRSQDDNDERDWDAKRRRKRLYPPTPLNGEDRHTSPHSADGGVEISQGRVSTLRHDSGGVR